MPELPILSKGHGKTKLFNYYTNQLLNSLNNKPRLTKTLKNEIDKWLVDFNEVPDTNDPLPQPVNRNGNTAFLFQIKKNSADHDELLGRVLDMVANDINYGAKFINKLENSRAKVHQDAQTWDANLDAYDREVDTYDDRTKAKDGAHFKQLAALKIRLKALRDLYNKSYMFEENLNDDSRNRYFLDINTCLNYIPTQHRWYPSVGKYTDKYTKITTTGTYIYDFQKNRFQLHIHCNPYTGKVRTIRVKLAGETHGKGSNIKSINANISNQFRDRHTPHPHTNHWTQVP